MLAWLKSVLHIAAGGTYLNWNLVRSVNWFKTFQRLLLHRGPHCNCRCYMTQALPSPLASSSPSPALNQEAADTLYAAHSSLGISALIIHSSQTLPQSSYAYQSSFRSHFMCHLPREAYSDRPGQRAPSPSPLSCHHPYSNLFYLLPRYLLMVRA